MIGLFFSVHLIDFSEYHQYHFPYKEKLADYIRFLFIICTCSGKEERRRIP